MMYHRRCRTCPACPLLLHATRVPLPSPGQSAGTGEETKRLEENFSYRYRRGLPFARAVLCCSWQRDRAFPRALPLVRAAPSGSFVLGGSGGCELAALLGSHGHSSPGPVVALLGMGTSPSAGQPGSWGPFSLTASLFLICLVLSSLISVI